MAFAFQRIARLCVDKDKLNFFYRTGRTTEATWHVTTCWIPSHNATACTGKSWARTIGWVKNGT